MICTAQILSFCIPISDKYSCAIEAIDSSLQSVSMNGSLARAGRI
jgi:hypothetical protein